MPLADLGTHLAETVPPAAIPRIVAIALAALTTLGLGVIKARDMLAANADLLWGVPVEQLHLEPLPVPAAQLKSPPVRRSDARQALPPPAQNVARLPFREDSASTDFINDFVREFLTPYLTGEITKENDPPNRSPMIHVLWEKLKQKYGADVLNDAERAKIEEIALRAYLIVGATGLFVNVATDELLPPIPTQTRRDMFLTALEEALPKDFPSRTFDVKIIRQQAKNALKQVERLKRQMYGK